MARSRHAKVALLTVLVAAAAVPSGGFAAGITGGAAPAAASADAGCSFPFSKVDATGTEVTVEEAPERVVTLAPSAAQTMWEIGAKDKVVGLTEYAMYLEGAESRANVSGPGQYDPPSTEKVVAANPDLVLAPNVVSNDTVAKMRDAGLTVYRFRFAGSIEDVKAKTLLTGKLVGACDGAEAEVDEMNRKLATVDEAVEGTDPPRVLYVFFGFTAGEGTFIDAMIERAGGKNVAAAANISGYKRISDETVVAQDPEWLLLNSDSPTVPKKDAYNSTTAVQEDNVLVLNANYISQPAPRIVRTIVKMAKAFHPEAYAEANATATPTPSPTETPTPTETPRETATPTPTPADSPGFGLVAAVGALLAGGALLRRR